MKTLLISAFVAFSPGLSEAAQMLGLDARERLFEVCSDELRKFELNSPSHMSVTFWENAEMPQDSESLYLDSVDTRAAFGATILDVLAVTGVREALEKPPELLALRSELLNYAVEDAANSKILVECAISNLGDSNITTASLFLGWLDCVKPFHEKLKEAHELTQLSSGDYANIADKTLGVNTPCRELVQ